MFMSDIQLTRAVLNRYADADGLTEEDVASLKAEFNLSEDQATALQDVFEDNFIGGSELKRLRGGWVRRCFHDAGCDTRVYPRLFSDTVVAGLAGSDGFAALRERISRLLSKALDPATPRKEWSRSLSALSFLLQERDEEFQEEPDPAITLAERITSARIPSILRNAIKETDPERRMRAVAFMNQIAMGRYDTDDQPTLLTLSQASQWLRHMGLIAADPGNDPELRIEAINSLARFDAVSPTDLPYGRGRPKRYPGGPPREPTPRQKQAEAVFDQWEAQVKSAIFDLVVVAIHDSNPDVREAAREAVRGN